MPDIFLSYNREDHVTAPQWVITPGQSVVIYESKVCLGGGIIV